MNQKAFDLLLVNPPPLPNWDYKKKYLYSPPAWILSIGTILKNDGFSVKLVDGAYEEDYLETVEDIVKANNLLFVGISAMTAQIQPALKTAAKIRRVNPLVPLVWGGVHPSLFPEQTAQHELVDVVVKGEGEYTSLELAKRIRQKQDYRDLAGAVCKIDNKLINNNPREFLVLEKLPFFDYDLLDIEKYILKDRTEVGGRSLKGGPIRRSLPILSGLGCPYHCAFCIESITKKKYRRRSAESLIAEVERLIAQYGINEVSFVDDTFFADRKRLLCLLDLLEERKIDIAWTTGGFRANYFHKDYLNVELLKRIRRLGGFHFGLGAESGSERILQKIDKQINKEQVMRAAKWCKEADINMSFGFMIGLPGEAEREMRETVKFAFNLVNQNPKNSCIFGPSVFRPYPGSRLFIECINNYDFRLPKSLEKWGSVYSLEEGYFKLENLPWIKKPTLVRLYSFYLNRAASNFTYYNVFSKLGSKILKKICHFRVRLNFYYFPIEFMLIKILKKYMKVD